MSTNVISSSESAAGAPNRIFDSIDATLALRKSTSHLVILDRSLRIIACDAGARLVLSELHANGALPVTLRHSVVRWLASGRSATQAVFPVNGDVVARCVDLEGEIDAMALLFERQNVRESLDGCASKFGLSSRERDVVRHLVEGRSSCEISTALGISEYTVGDYLKRAFAKTKTRTRAELVAVVLGWRAATRKAEGDRSAGV